MYTSPENTFAEEIFIFTGDKLAVETILHALEDSNPTVQNAAVDGLILLGDVYEEEAGENRLLEVMITSVQPRLARSQCNNSTHDSSEVHISFDDSDQLVRQQKAEESGDTDRNVKWMLSVAVEPEITLAGDCGPVQALQHWITLFGIQDFDSRVRGMRIKTHSAFASAKFSIRHRMHRRAGLTNHALTGTAFST